MKDYLAEICHSLSILTPSFHVDRPVIPKPVQECKSSSLCLPNPKIETPVGSILSPIRMMFDMSFFLGAAICNKLNTLAMCISWIRSR